MRLVKKAKGSHLKTKSFTQQSSSKASLNGPEQLHYLVDSHKPAAVMTAPVSANEKQV